MRLVLNFIFLELKIPHSNYIKLALYRMKQNILGLIDNPIRFDKYSSNNMDVDRVSGNFPNSLFDFFTSVSLAH